MEDYKPMVENAYSAVKELPEGLQLKAFEMLLTKMLNQQDGIVPVPNIVQQKEAQTPSTITNPIIQNGDRVGNNIGLEGIAAKLNVSINVINDIIAVDTVKKEIKLKMHLNFGGDKDNQVAAALIYILAKKYGLNDDIGDSYEIGETVKVMGIRSLSNLVTNLNRANSTSERTLFVIGGVKKGKKTYRITDYGEAKALELLKKYITGE